MINSCTSNIELTTTNNVSTSEKAGESKPAFITLMIKYFKQIISDSYQRQQDANLKQSPEKIKTLLSKGIWYPQDYYKALSKFNEIKRRDWLVETNIAYTGFAPVKYFSKVPDSSSQSISGYKIMNFQVKSGVKTTEALDKLGTFSLLDCGSVVHLAAANALKELLTEERFDYLFATEANPFYLSNSEQSSMDCLFTTVKIENEEDIQVGDHCFFGSIKKYVHKHPFGEARGFNVLRFDDDYKKYLCLGLDPAGQSGEEIEQSLFNAYNSDPIDEGFVTPAIRTHIFSKFLCQNEAASNAFVKSLKFDKITWEDFHKTPSRITTKPTKGKLDLIVYRPNLKRIEHLVQAPLSEIRNIYNSFKTR